MSHHSSSFRYSIHSNNSNSHKKGYDIEKGHVAQIESTLDGTRVGKPPFINKMYSTQEELGNQRETLDTIADREKVVLPLHRNSRYLRVPLEGVTQIC